MTNNLKSSTYISIRSGQYFYWPDDLVSRFLKLECLRLQKKQNTSLPHGGGGGGGYFKKNWVRVCGTLPESVTLFQTKISEFPYPISDLIKNLTCQT